MDRDDILFLAEMSSRYHRRRAAFLERLSNLFNAVTLIGGASAFLALINSGSETANDLAKFLTAMIAIIGVVQSIYRIEQAAFENKKWLVEWMDLLTEVYNNENPSAEMIRDWVRRKNILDSQTVCELRALQVDCANKTASALGLHYSGRLRWYHKFLMQVISFENSSFPA